MFKKLLLISTFLTFFSMTLVGQTITSADYDVATGNLVVTGTGITNGSGGGDDIDASQFSITAEGETYQLTDTPDVDPASATSFTLVLSAADQEQVHRILNKNGLSSTDGVAYNLTVALNWNEGAGAADNGPNAITVSNVAVPTINSVTYDIATSNLVVAGTGFVKRNGVGDIDASMFTITGEGAATDAYTLTTTADVEITSTTAFTLVLSAADKDKIDQIVNKNLTASTGGTTYNLGAGEDWAVGADAAVNVVDATGNGITASNVANPTITGFAYDATVGVFTITGTGFLSSAGKANDVDASLFTVTGEGGATYTLTNTPDPEITSTTSITLTLSAKDKDEVNQIINKLGAASTGATNYDLAVLDNWAMGADPAVADLSHNAAFNASNVLVPTILYTSYNKDTGYLHAFGTGFSSRAGQADIDASMFTFTGLAGSSVALTTSLDVEIASTTDFTIVLSESEKIAVNNILDKFGTSSADNTTYNLAAAEDWIASADAAVNVVDATSSIDVSGTAGPIGQNDAVTTLEDLTYTFKASDFTFSHIGGNTFNGIKVSSLNAKGTLQLEGENVNAGQLITDVTKLTFAPVENENGSAYTAFTFKLNDSEGNLSNSTYTMTINVTAVNDAPVAKINTGVTVLIGKTIVLNETLLQFDDIDNDNDALKYHVVTAPKKGSIQMSGLSVTLFTQKQLNDGLVSYVHTDSTTAKDTLVFKVVDASSKESENINFVVTISDGKNAPIFTTLPEITFNEDNDAFYSFETMRKWVTDSDTDDSLLTLSFKAVDDKITTGKDQSLWVIRAKENWFGESSIKLSVTDGTSTVDTMLTVKVTSVNDKPELIDLPSIIEFINTDSTSLDLTGKFKDVESSDSAITFSFASDPDSLKLDFDRANLILNISAMYGFSGNAVLTVTVKDSDGGETSADIPVVVDNAITSVDGFNEIPTEFVLNQNYPNPFNPETTIKYAVPSEGKVTLTIYNILGSMIETHTFESSIGYHEFKWDATKYASGIYIYNLSGQNVNISKKMILIK